MTAGAEGHAIRRLPCFCCHLMPRRVQPGAVKQGKSTTTGKPYGKGKQVLDVLLDDVLDEDASAPLQNLTATSRTSSRTALMLRGAACLACPCPPCQPSLGVSLDCFSRSDATSKRSIGKIF